MIATEHYAYCDNPGCELHEQVGTESVFSVADLRRNMRDGGWGKRNGKELCADCVEEYDKAARVARQQEN